MSHNILEHEFIVMSCYCKVYVQLKPLVFILTTSVIMCMRVNKLHLWISDIDRYYLLEQYYSADPTMENNAVSIKLYYLALLIFDIFIVFT